MNDHEIRTLYPSVQTADMRTRVLNGIHGEKQPHVGGKIRLSAILCAALACVLMLTAGAAAIRGVRILLPQGEEDYIWIRDPETGELKKEFAYRVQTDEETVALSDEALSRLAPYWQHREGAQVYESTSLSELEALLGISLHLPAGETEKIQLRAYEMNGEPVEVLAWIHLRSADGTPYSVTVTLPLQNGITGTSVNIMSDVSDAEVYPHTLGNGYPAQIVLTRMERSYDSFTTLYYRSTAYYSVDGVVYSFTLNKGGLIEKMPVDMSARMIAEMKGLLSSVK
ncbi:MAG: hypothetical protein E7662_09215 [Ruminococcaceae bacterium]|nr:hypothetical protein [Oscillospiraceae bacterium]